MKFLPALSPRAERITAALLLAVALALLIWFFEQLPIEGTLLGLDWYGFWVAVQGGQLRYAQNVLNPPWSIWPIIPLGLLSFRASWGVLTLATIMVLMLCVPRPAPAGKRWLATALLILSFPSLRHIVDGNLEGLVIGGILLIVYGYNQRQTWALALGLLLATAKPQEVWGLVLVVGWGLLRHWPPRQWIKLAGLVSAAVIASLFWKGAAWWPFLTAISYSSSIIDISLSAAIARLGWPPIITALGYGVVGGVTLLASLKHTAELSREKAALVAGASMLLSPYTAGNSFLTILAIGIIPIFLVRPGLGGLLLALTNLPFLADRDMLYNWQAYYWTGLLLMTWGVFAWQVWREPIMRQPTT